MPASWKSLPPKPDRPLIEYLLDVPDSSPKSYDEETYDEKCDHCSCWDEGGSCCDCGESSPNCGDLGEGEDE